MLQKEFKYQLGSWSHKHVIIEYKCTYCKTLFIGKDFIFLLIRKNIGTQK